MAVIVITLAFSYIAFKGLKPGQAWRALESSNHWWLGAALVAFGLGCFARALRWRSLFARGRRPPLGVVMNAMMVGYLYNSILPARAGEAARVVVVTKRSSCPPVETVGTVALERVYDIVGVLVIFFIAEPWLPHVTWFGNAAIAALVLAMLIAAGAVTLAIYKDRPLRLLLRPVRSFRVFSGDRLERTIAELTHGLSGLRHSRVALEALLWTLVAWVLTAACAYLVTLGFHLGLPIASGVLVTAAIGLGMVLPSPPAAVGVFEGAALIALKPYGVPYSSALPYALTLHLVNLVPFVIVGGLLLQYNARRPRKEVARGEMDPTLLAGASHLEQ